MREAHHLYGDTVHIVSDPVANTYLAQLRSPAIDRKSARILAATLYRMMAVYIADVILPSATISVPTRMITYNPEAVWTGRVIADTSRIVLVEIPRGGTLASEVCLDVFSGLLGDTHVRKDIVMMNRSHATDGHVDGIEVQGKKMGRSIDGAVVIFPDGMGATGGTICQGRRIYEQKISGTAAKFVAAHLVVTPECITRMRKEYPDTQIFAFALDRGLSTPRALAAIMGEFPGEERGLNGNDYVVPGLGDYGNVLNGASDDIVTAGA